MSPPPSLKSVFSFAVVLFSINQVAIAQSNTAKLIQDGAIELPSRTAATPGLYEAIRSKQAILIGEMHGTKQPPEFAQGVVETLLSQQRPVILGLEAVGTKADAYIRAGQLDSLKAHWKKLFLMDGRHNSSWLDLVWRYHRNPNVTLVLFDQTDEQIPHLSRDRSMAENLLQALQKRPDAVIVTLSGNIHNQLKPYNETETMGYFLHTVSNTPLQQNQILSVTHFYGAGTMMNSQGNGLQLRQVPDNSGEFSTAVPYQSYFLLTDMFPMWNSLLFTRTVTAAESPK
ncbi:MAG: hypothetical protein LH609_10165 [Rudanella sp.]|nr:hypothetical protein [Rudanella sp.]